MKSFIIFTMLLSFSAWAKTTVQDFNQLLIEDMKEDVKSEKFEKKKSLGRGPASVDEPTNQDKLNDHKKKIDKSKNVNQLGRPEW